MGWLEGAAAFFGIKLPAAIIGFVGAVVSLKFVRRAETWWEKTTMVIGGALAAGYLEPPISAYFKVSTVAPVAFLVGLLGMSLAAALIDFIENTKFGKLFAEIIRKRYGGGGGGDAPKE